ncbi:hypothetical protein BS47DRAFT_1342836 [Hydnum rufescens UP504]|uniref:Uncharacterized protein n=1 Tax=Hydnum rufescens UP504 TaxID=1448309 RepID=A0A9P6DY97_9AGAM|nr:hypothetical protein BS47DRAFT_1342836 [Hydnum rufescens UP504]
MLNYGYPPESRVSKQKQDAPPVAFGGDASHAGYINGGTIIHLENSAGRDYKGDSRGTWWKRHFHSFSLMTL